MFERLGAAGGGSSSITLAQGLGLQPTWAGFPIVINQKLPTAPSNNEVMLLFGDLQLSTTMGVRRDLRVMTSTERYMEYDQIGILVTERYNVVNHDLGDSSTAGPMVGLMGNT